MTSWNRNPFLPSIHSNKYNARQRKSDVANLLQKQPEKRCCYCDIFTTLYRRCCVWLAGIKALNSFFILSGNKMYQMTSVRRKHRKQISFFFASIILHIRDRCCNLLWKNIHSNSNFVFQCICLPHFVYLLTISAFSQSSVYQTTFVEIC